jgi:hypothetical protein
MNEIPAVVVFANRVYDGLVRTLTQTLAAPTGERYQPDARAVKSPFAGRAREHA